MKELNTPNISKICELSGLQNTECVEYSYVSPYPPLKDASFSIDFTAGELPHATVSFKDTPDGRKSLEAVMRHLGLTWD
jgi:hypothetical protein